MAKAPKRMSTEDKAKKELGDAVLNKMGFHGPTKHSTNALERSKVRTMAEYGDSYGSDSSIEDEVAGAMNDSPGGGYMEMPAKQAFAHIGLSKPSPELMQLWDNVAPAQRKGIVDAILSNVAAPIGDPYPSMVRDAQYNLGGDPDDEYDGMGPDGEGYSSERPVPGGDASYPTDDFQYDDEVNLLADDKRLYPSPHGSNAAERAKLQQLQETGESVEDAPTDSMINDFTSKTLKQLGPKALTMPAAQIMQAMEMQVDPRMAKALDKLPPRERLRVFETMDMGEPTDPVVDDRNSTTDAILKKFGVK